MSQIDDEARVRALYKGVYDKIDAHRKRLAYLWLVLSGGSPWALVIADNSEQARAVGMAPEPSEARRLAMKGERCTARVIAELGPRIAIVAGRSE